MGIRVTKGADLDVRLDKIADKSTRALRRLHEEAADAMSDTAQQMSPYKTGTLEGSIGVTEEIGDKNRVVRYIGHTEDVPYAVYMHENVYDLGPGSQAKQEAGTFMVGRKYLERAAEWLVRDWGLFEKSREIIKRNLK